MCLDCIGVKTGLSDSEIDHYLIVIATRLQLHRLDDRCRACGNTSVVFAFERPAS
jgi:hypothetical protein